MNSRVNSSNISYTLLFLMFFATILIRCQFEQFSSNDKYLQSGGQFVLIDKPEYEHWNRNGKTSLIEMIEELQSELDELKVPDKAKSRYENIVGFLNQSKEKISLKKSISDDSQRLIRCLFIHYKFDVIFKDYWYLLPSVPLSKKFLDKQNFQNFEISELTTEYDYFIGYYERDVCEQMITNSEPYIGFNNSRFDPTKYKTMFSYPLYTNFAVYKVDSKVNFDSILENFNLIEFKEELNSRINHFRSKLRKLEKKDSNSN